MKLCTFRRGICLAAAVLLPIGCGWLSDADRIVIARMHDRVIRREDLNRVLRDMQPEERPFIKNRGDLLRVLEQMVDRIVKEKLAEDLQKQGKLDMPRELAAQRFDMLFPRYISMIQNYEKFGLTEQDRAGLQQEREMRIDKIEKEMLGEFALLHRLQEEMKNGTLTATDEELRREYELRREDLYHFETVRFEGVIFPVQQPEASALAAKAQERMKAGERPDDIAAEYAATGKGVPIASAIENDPRKADRYGAFWQQVSGARPGDIAGPLYIRGWERAVTSESGEPASEPIPEAFLVCKIMDARPPMPKTFEEAKEDLRPILLYAKLVKKLREENGVVILEHKLPDPAAYGGAGPRSVFDQQDVS